MTEPVKVGWVVDYPSAQLVFAAPTPVRDSRIKALSRRAVQACPAVNDLEFRLFEIKCPFNLRLRLESENDEHSLYSVPEGTRLDDDLINSFVTLMSPEFWRSSNHPVIQIRLPYYFVADDEVYLDQFPPFMSTVFRQWPGLLISGRFPTSLWPRSLNWAFEWHETDKDLILRRNQPWCYIYFETKVPDRKVELVRAEQTPELIEYRRGISDTPKYMSNTFSLFEEAKSRRPKTLLVEKITDD